MNAAVVVGKLIERGYFIACAESCTGGMLASALVDVPDASKVMKESHVTYWEEAKVKYAGVQPETIDVYGVVSEEVAGQMAKGVAENADAQVGVGITGIAGPAGGTDKTPVGTVCFGISINGEVKTFTKYFGNIGRNNVRKESVEFVFEELEKMLATSQMQPSQPEVDS